MRRRPPPGHARGRGRSAAQRRSHRRASAGRWLRRCATIASTATMLVAATGFVLYRHLDGDIRTVEVAAGPSAPTAGQGAMNLLVLGSDTRGGQGDGYGSDDHAGLSDTAMLVHLEPGRRAATVVSIPRDLLVSRPACRYGSRGSVGPAQGVQFNTALAVGGPACSAATTQALTGLRVDHVLEVDFSGFKRLVDSLGGVTVCLPYSVTDRDSHLTLSAGRHTVTGDEALAFVRDRHGVGDGSDLARIQMQHQFLASLAQKLTATHILSRPDALYQLADAATHSISTDPALASLRALAGFATSLRHLSTSRVVFTTLPVVKDPANINRLLPDDRADAALYAALRGTAPSATATTPPGTTRPSGGERPSATGASPGTESAEAPPVALAERFADQNLCAGNPARD